MQARILFLTDTEDDKIKMTLLVRREEKTYRKTVEISESSYEALGFPSVGADISEAEYKLLLKSARASDATPAAVNILSYGDNNRATLLRKLRAKGYTKEASEAAVAKMLKAGYINEREQAYRYTITLANSKKMGPRKIYPYLMSRGYERKDIEYALSRAVDEREISFEDIKLSLILKYRPENSEEEKTLLYKHGFSVGDGE